MSSQPPSFQPPSFPSGAGRPSAYPPQYVTARPRQPSPHLVEIAYGQRKRSGWEKFLRRLPLILFLGLAACVGLMVHDAFQVRGALERISATVQTIDIGVLDNPATAHDIVVQLQSDSSIAARALSGPLWVGATHIPQFGDDIAAVRTLTATISDLTDRGLPELLDAAITIRFLNVNDVNSETLNRLTSQIGIGDEALSTGISRLRGIDQTDLLPELAIPITQLIDQLVVLRATTSSLNAVGGLASAASQILALLGL